MKYIALIVLMAPLWGQADSPCLDCHDATVEPSAHVDLSCEDCHSGVDLDLHTEEGEVPHFSEQAACGGCHEEEWDLHAESVHGLRLTPNNGDVAGCSDCHGTHTILPSDDLASSTHPAKLIGTCGRCHSDAGLMERHQITIADPVLRYEQSVHFKVLEESGYQSATCNDCHGTHDIRNMRHAQSTINFWNVAATCGQCHTREYQEFRESDHWIALQKGLHDAPSCISCHGEHAIDEPSGGDVTSKRDAADRTCLKCHADDAIALKYGLPEGVVAAYQDSYHGLALSRGDEDAAACFDCHGVHAIMGAQHPASTINDANLVTTCAVCHPNATPQFSQSYSHSSVMIQDYAIEDLVGKIYLALIIGVIGFMVLHNGILLAGYLKRRRRRNLAPDVDQVRRFSRMEVWQHILMLTSFTILVITGFALKFGDTWWARMLTDIGLTETARGLIHRMAAAVMVTVSVWHLLYIITSRWGRGHFVLMLPRWFDVTQLAGTIKANLTGGPVQSRYDCFDYTEKLEYWALVWGTVVMIVTGFILWFPTLLSAGMPVWFIKVAEAVHYWEAWLAMLAIMVWHLFFTVFHPDEYPGNNTMFFSGRMSRRHWQSKHPAFIQAVDAELAAYERGDVSWEQLSVFAQDVSRQRDEGNEGGDSVRNG